MKKNPILELILLPKVTKVILLFLLFPALLSFSTSDAKDIKHSEKKVDIPIAHGKGSSSGYMQASPPYTLAIRAVSTDITEGDGVNASFILTLMDRNTIAPATSSTLPGFNITFRVTGGVTNADYNRSPLFSVLFPPQGLTTTVDIPIINDDIIEAVETLSLRIITVDNANVALPSSTNSLATVVVNDDDKLLLYFANSDVQINEGNIGKQRPVIISIVGANIKNLPSDMNFDFQLTKNSSATDVDTSDIEGPLATNNSITITIPRDDYTNVKTLTIPIIIKGDITLEATEFLSLGISATSPSPFIEFFDKGSPFLPTASASDDLRISIINDDFVLGIISTVNGNEENKTSASFQIAVMREGIPIPLANTLQSGLTVNYSLSGTARGGSTETPTSTVDATTFDYDNTRLTGRISLPRTTGTVNIEVPIFEDTVTEIDDTIVLTIDNIALWGTDSIVLLDSAKSSTATITDNEVPYEVRINSVSRINVTEGDVDNVVTFRFELFDLVNNRMANSNVLTSDIAVAYRVSGTNITISDYRPSSLSGSVIFNRLNNGFAVVDSNIRVQNDEFMEYEEVLRVTITGVSGSFSNQVKLAEDDNNRWKEFNIIDNDYVINNYSVKVRNLNNGAENPNQPISFRFELESANFEDFRNGFGENIEITYRFTGTATGAVLGSGNTADYNTPANLVAVIQNGNMREDLTITVVNDAVAGEGTETVVAEVLSARTTSGRQLQVGGSDASQTTAIIIDDDVEFEVGVVLTQHGAEAPNSPMIFTFNMVDGLGATTAPTEDITVEYTLTGSATGLPIGQVILPTTDYTAPNATNTITLPNGTAVGTAVTFSVINDTQFDGVEPESVILTITRVSAPVLKVTINTTNGSNTATGFILDNEQLEIAIVGANAITTAGGMQTYTVNTNPTGYSRSNLKWSVDRKSIAEINASGQLTARGNGNVIVMANLNGAISTTIVNVSGQVNTPPSTNVLSSMQVIGPQIINSPMSTPVTYTVQPFPSTATLPANPVWSVDRTAVATISNTGVLTPVSNGIVTITLTSGEMTSGLRIEIKGLTNTATVLNPLTGISIIGPNLISVQDQKTTFKASLLPSDAVNTGSITWSLDKPTVATIDAMTGELTLIKNGVIEVKASMPLNGMSVTDTKTVIISGQPDTLSGIDIIGPDTITTSGGTASYRIQVAPSTFTSATNVTSWSVLSGTEIATIDQNTGVVTAVANGVVVIEASLNGKTSVHQITVSNQPTTATVMPQTVVQSINIIGLAQLTSASTTNERTYSILANPLNAALNTLAWSVNANNGIASIDVFSGVVTLLSQDGVFNVIAATPSGLRATRTVVVTGFNSTPVNPVVNPTGIVISGLQVITNVNTPVQYSIDTIPPGLAAPGRPQWSVNNTNIAYIDPNTGVLTGLTAGVVEVIVVEDGKSDTHSVTIAPSRIDITRIKINGATSLSGTTAVSYAVVATAGTVDINAVSWHVSDISLASVGTVAGNTVLLTPKSNGEVTLIANTLDGHTASLNITLNNTGGQVVPAKTDLLSLTVSGPETVIRNIGETSLYTYTAILVPSTATGAAVTWTTDNNQIATIDSNTGDLTPVATGKVLVTATSGAYKGFIEVEAVVVGNTGPVRPARVTPMLNGIEILGPPVVSKEGDTAHYSVIASELGSRVFLRNNTTWRIEGTRGVATIDTSTGVLTAKEGGSIEVVATTVDNNITYTSRMPVFINLPPKPLAKSILIEGANRVFSMPGVSTYTISTIPADASKLGLRWAVSNPGIATIGEDGILTVVATGSVFVLASLNGQTDSHNVHVEGINNQIARYSYAIPASFIQIEGVHTLTNTSTIGERTFTITTIPHGTKRGVNTWSVDAGNGVATINAITGVVELSGSDGMFNITATTNNGLQAHRLVTVTGYSTPATPATTLTGIVLNGLKVINVLSQEVQYRVQPIPASFSLTGATSWSVDNPAIATIVSTTGVLTPVSEGFVTITATHAGQSTTQLVEVRTTPRTLIAINIDIIERPPITTAGGSQTYSIYVNPLGASTAGTIWSVDNPGVAQVSDTGVLTAVANGTVLLSASLDGNTDVLPVTITGQATTALAPLHVDVPTSISIDGKYSLSQSHLMNAADRTYTVATTPVNSNVGKITWSVVNNNNIATIDANTGVVTLLGRDGMFSIIANTAMGLSAIRQVLVVSYDIEGNRLLTLSSISIDGLRTINVLNTPVQYKVALAPVSASLISPITWSTDDTSIATIDATTGVLTPLTAGVVKLTARNMEHTATLSVTIQLTPILPKASSIEVAGPSSINANGGTETYTITARPQGSPSNGVQWSVDNPDVAQISDTGVLTALANGVTAIHATLDGYTDTHLVTITGQTRTSTGIVPIRLSELLSIDGAPSLSSSSTEAERTFTVVTVPVNTNAGVTTWSVDAGNGVASIDAMRGVVTLLGSNGVFNVKAITTSGLEASRRVIVEGFPNQANILVDVSSIAIDGLKIINTLGLQTTYKILASPASVAVGATVWSVDNAAVASIDSGTGVLTSVAEGTVIISATMSGQTATLNVIVRNSAIPQDVVSIKVEGATSISTAGGSSTFTVSTAPTGAVQSGLQWSVDNPGVATISNAGVLTAVANGIVSVYANINGVTDVHTVTISGQPTLSTADLPTTKAKSISIDGNARLIATSTEGERTFMVVTNPTNTNPGTITWRVDAGNGIASIDPTSGIVALTGPTGVFNIVATTTAGLTATKQVVVSGATGPAPLQSTLTGISIDGLRVLNALNQSVLFKAIPSPASALLTQPLIWSVDNTAVATIDRDSGILTSVSDGNVIVSIQYGTQSASIPVVVQTSPITPILSGIDIVGVSDVNTPTTTTYTLEPVPAGASLDGVQWSVDNPGIATISDTGVLTTISNGVASVFATVNGFTDVYKVTVMGRGSTAHEFLPITIAQSISIAGRSYLTNTAPAVQRTYSVIESPAKTNVGTITWRVEGDASIATIDATLGIITLTGSGGVINVIAESSIGLTSSKRVVISSATGTQAPIQNTITGISIDGLRLINTLSKRVPYRVIQNAPSAILTGATAWSVDNTAVATIDATSGVLTTVAEGTVTISATYSGQTAALPVIIRTTSLLPEVYGISINGASTLSTSGATETYTITTAPLGLTTTGVLWSVDNTGVATISDTGLLTAIANGNVTIHASLNGITDVYVVNISGQTTIGPIPLPIVTADAISLEGQSILTSTSTLAERTYSVVTNPVNTNAGTITWRVNAGNGVATIDSATGIVTLTGENGGFIVSVTTTEGLTAIRRAIVTGYGTTTTIQTALAGVFIDGLNVINTLTTQVQYKVLPTPDTAVLTGTPTWSVDNAMVATIDATTGVLTSISDGKVVVSVDQAGQTATLPVIIRSKPIVPDIIGININGPTAVTTPSGTETYTITTTPLGGVNTGVVWSIDNPGVATISDRGVLTAVSNGEVSINASLNGFSEVFVVTISGQPDTAPKLLPTVVASSIAIVGESLLTPSSTLAKRTFTLVTNPTKTYTGTITWRVDPANTIATIDSTSGVVILTGMNGIFNVQAEVEVGLTATLPIAVTGFTSLATQPETLTGIAIDGLKVVNALSKTVQYRVLPIPGIASITGATMWSVDKSTLASIDASTGALTSIAEGDVIITAENGGQTTTLKVTIRTSDITPKAVGVQISGSSTISTQGGSESYTITTLPARVSQDGLVWSVDNPSIATVDSKGVLTPKVNGDIILSASLDGATDVYSIQITGQQNTETVLPESTIPRSIQIDGPINLKKTSSIAERTYTITTVPANAAPGTITWRVDGGNEVATISTTGVLSLLGKDGLIIIEARSSTGLRATKTILISEHDQIKVNINSPLTDISINGISTINKLTDRVQYTIVPHPISAVLTGNPNWSTNNSQVATIDQKGLLTPITAGDVVISVSQSGQSASHSVRIDTSAATNKPIKLYIVGPSTIDGPTATTYKIVSFPTNLDLTGLTWHINSNQLALLENVSTNAVDITPVGDGKIMLLAALKGVVGHTEVTLSNTGITNPELIEPNTVINIIVDGPDNLILQKPADVNTNGAQYTVVAVPPSAQSNVGVVTWAVDHSEIASINSSGRLTAVATGRITITAILSNSVRGSKVVEVVVPGLVVPNPIPTLTDLEINGPSIISSSSPVQYTVRALETGATLPSSIVWSLEGTDVNFLATIDARTGVLTALELAEGLISIVASGNGIRGVKNVRLSPQYSNIVKPTVNPLLTNNNQPEMSGTGAPGFKIRIMAGSATPIITTVDAEGNWKAKFDTTLQDGIYNVVAQLLNKRDRPIGGTKAKTTQVKALIIDTIPPDAPIFNEAGKEQEKASPALSGTAEVNSRLQVEIAGQTYTTTTSDVGQWNINEGEIKPLQLGRGYDVVIKVTDATGNTRTSTFEKINGLLIKDTRFYSNQGVSPNGDGMNDVLLINNIENFPNNRVVIVNTWGNIVYSTDKYDNKNNVFNGMSDSGSDLPSGNYYFMIDKNDGSKAITGFFMLVK